MFWIMSYFSIIENFPGGSANLHSKNWGVPRKVLLTGAVHVHLLRVHLWLINTIQSISRLYSEKAYVLSRGFVLRALEIPLGGLEAEIRWLYYTEGRLAKVLCDSRTLIQKSQSGEVVVADQSLAVPRLTTGGIIMLERTLSKLQVILDRT